MKKPKLFFLLAFVSLQTALFGASDGTVVAWGDNLYGQSTVPTNLSGVVAIASGWYHSLALKSKVTVVAWGWNNYGQSTPPANLSGVVAIAAGWYHSLALKSDGTVVAWGNNTYGQCNVPTNLVGVVAIAGGFWHSLALKNDGTVVAWGGNDRGQCTVPTNLVGVVAIAGGGEHSLALKSNGTVEAWGRGDFGQCNVPTNLSEVVAIAGGAYHSLALVSMVPFIIRQPQGQTGYWGKEASFSVAVSGLAPLFYQWFKDDMPLLDATNSTLVLTNLAMTDNGSYTVVVSNSAGCITSSPAMLLVNPAGISLGSYPGITVDGVVGRTYGIQSSTNLDGGGFWTTLTNLTLTQTVQLWIDTSVDMTSPAHPRRFYRVVPVP